MAIPPETIELVRLLFICALELNGQTYEEAKQQSTSAGPFYSVICPELAGLSPGDFQQAATKNKPTLRLYVPSSHPRIGDYARIYLDYNVTKCTQSMFSGSSRFRGQVGPNAWFTIGNLPNVPKQVFSWQQEAHQNSHGDVREHRTRPIAQANDDRSLAGMSINTPPIFAAGGTAIDDRSLADMSTGSYLGNAAGGAFRRRQATQNPVSTAGTATVAPPANWSFPQAREGTLERESYKASNIWTKNDFKTDMLNRQFPDSPSYPAAGLRNSEDLVLLLEQAGVLNPHEIQDNCETAQDAETTLKRIDHTQAILTAYLNQIGYQFFRASQSMQLIEEMRKELGEKRKIVEGGRSSGLSILLAELRIGYDGPTASLPTFVSGSSTHENDDLTTVSDVTMHTTSQKKGGNLKTEEEPLPTVDEESTGNKENEEPFVEDESESQY